MPLSPVLPAWLSLAMFQASPPGTLTVKAPGPWRLQAQGQVVSVPPGAALTLRREPGGVRARWPGGAALATLWTARGDGPWELRSRTGLRRLSGRWRVGTGTAGALRITAVVPLETWVAGALAAELPATAPAAAAEAQAACIRSFAAGAAVRPRHGDAQLCDATHCLRFAPEAREPRRHRAAREATQGLCLVWRGQPALAVWHAACGGWSADAATAFGREAVPYLRSRPDRGPGGAPWCEPRTWQVGLTPTEVASALAAAGLWPRRARVHGLEVVARDPGGHVSGVRIRGDTLREVSGLRFWHALGPGLGWQGLRSLRFDIAPRAGGWLVRGTGLGHGVGMCQAGALARASHGASRDELLQAYFPGTRLERCLTGAQPTPW